MKHYLRIYVIILTLSNVIAQETTGPPAVAVLDFDARGLPTYEVETLTERLRSEIANTGRAILVDRQSMFEIMDEQGFEFSGCTSDECVAEVGVLLGAQYMISGSVSKLGDSYTLDAKMVSVTTGAAVRTKTLTHEGPESELIVEMETLAWEIVGLKAPQRLLLKHGGEKSEDKMTLAILDFDPTGISIMEAQYLNYRFATQVSNTDSTILTDRQSMYQIMDEQGFESTGCSSDECLAEAGVLLGVQYLIKVAIVKLDDTYTLDAKMFEVAGDTVAVTKNVTYSGPMGGLITEIEILAWEMLDLKAPKVLLKKRTLSTIAGGRTTAGKSRGGAVLRSTILPGWGQFYSNEQAMGRIFMRGEAFLGLLAYLSYKDYQTEYSNAKEYQKSYNNAFDINEMRHYKEKALQALDNANGANDQYEIMLYIIGGVWVTNIVHAYLTSTDQNGAAKKTKFDLVYNPEIRQPQLRLSIALD